MNLPLDAHGYLWFVIHSPRLSQGIYRRIETTPVAYVSAASRWRGGIRLAQVQVEVSTGGSRTATARKSSFPAVGESVAPFRSFGLTS